MLGIGEKLFHQLFSAEPPFLELSGEDSAVLPRQTPPVGDHDVRELLSRRFDEEVTTVKATQYVLIAPLSSGHWT